jgi:signal transduction histidine kinase/CheY-like chemotaxis protein
VSLAGTFRHHLARAVPLLDNAGNIREWIGTSNDITERRQAEEARERLYQELRENDKRKDEFLAMLAHELRNPLAAIGNAVMLSTRSGLQEHIDWSMEVINRQIKHLSRLIDDLLDVSRISRGKIALRTTVLDVTPILDNAVETLRPLVDERKHELTISIDRGNLWVNADPTRLEQIVINLVTNAAKYTDNRGHIWITARNDRENVVITVKDSGVGIPPERMSEMFELFAQGDRTLARSEGGLGIGLTVVKKLVELHNGSITARSEGVNKGSEFSVRLPAAKRPAGVKAHGTGPAAAPSFPARILVVDDNVDMAKGLARLLTLVGHDVKTAHDGPNAIEVARAHRPEIVLLDIGLPGMDGYEVASMLRHDGCCRGAVFIAISGYGQDDDIRRSKEAGFDHYLVKPIDHDALLTLVSEAAPG